MRHLVFPALLSAAIAFAGTTVAAFEFEALRLFEAKDEQHRLKVISTTDIYVIEPLIVAFQEEYPAIAIDYTVASSTELMKALHEEQVPFDVALSSAMDLQTKLANDGLTREYRSEATQLLPEWANWRDHVFAFTQEPATIIASPSAFDGLEVPRSRQALISLLRDHPERFRGRVGTYDIRTSGVGYLFATQDARTSEIFWRLTEVLGGLRPKLYCCSGQMIEDVSNGQIALAYNVLGSYAQARKEAGDQIEIIAPEEFTTVMLRLAVIPANAEDPENGGALIDFLLSAAWSGEPPEYYPFQSVDQDFVGQTSALRPIQIGPGLLVFLDKLKRQRFINEWADAIQQE